MTLIVVNKFASAPCWSFCTSSTPRNPLNNAVSTVKFRMSSCTRNICNNRSEQLVDAGKEIDVDQIINFILAKKQQNPGPTYRDSTWTLELMVGVYTVETRWFGVEHSVGWSWAAELGMKIRLKREKTKGKNSYGDETE